MNNCKFCSRIISNKGSLASHELCCKENPNKIKRKTSPDAGQRKGCTPWNKGKKFTELTQVNLEEKVESGVYKNFCEAHARTLIKKYLIYKNGHKCMLCGLSEWLENQIPLVCDHIDGNSDNQDLSNVRIICNNCDSISSTFKGRNRGKGRKNRYKN
jgi:hypothetical protein